MSCFNINASFIMVLRERVFCNFILEVSKVIYLSLFMYLYGTLFESFFIELLDCCFYANVRFLKIWT